MRDQGTCDSVDHFVSVLRKLFALTYPTEDPALSDLLKQILTDCEHLSGSTCSFKERQLRWTLLSSKLWIEYALYFAKMTEDSKEVNVVQTCSDEVESVAQLQRYGATDTTTSVSGESTHMYICLSWDPSYTKRSHTIMVY